MPKVKCPNCRKIVETSEMAGVVCRSCDDAQKAEARRGQEVAAAAARAREALRRPVTAQAKNAAFGNLPNLYLNRTRRAANEGGHDDDVSMLRNGDIVITTPNMSFGHVGLVVGDGYLIWDYVNSGFQELEVCRWTGDFIRVFRAQAVSPEDLARVLAQAKKIKEAGATYSKSRAVFKVGFGSTVYGPDAKARLAKYRSRDNESPKNLTCTEYALLSYQIPLGDDHPAFIKLDASRCKPNNLKDWFASEANSGWDLIGRIVPNSAA